MALGLWVPRGWDPQPIPMYVRPTAFWRGWWTSDDDGIWSWIDNESPPMDVERAAAVRALTLARLT